MSEHDREKYWPVLTALSTYREPKCGPRVFGLMFPITLTVNTQYLANKKCGPSSLLNIIEILDIFNGFL